MNLSLASVGALVRGRVDGNAQVEVRGYSIDSRTIRDGDLFFAIPGPRVDGHDFVSAAARGGAVAAVVSRDVDRPEGIPLVRVDSTLESLHALASGVRRRWGGTVVGITGSAGKTTTKDLIVAVLEQKYRVLGSKGNLNNTYGMPLCLLGVEPDDDIAVLEMGMSATGEISDLAAIAEPNEGVITNVGAAHLENFRSVDDIARAKAELLAGLVGERRAYLNNADARVRAMAEGFRGRVVTYGVNVSADFEVTRVEQRGLDEMRFTVRHRGEEHPFRISLPGPHNVANAAAAISVGVVHGVGWDAVEAAISGFGAARMRGAAVHFREGFTVIDDSYNSNPAALEEMVGMLASAPGFSRRILVAGDMLELGPESARFHAECGKHAVGSGVDLIIGVGEYAKHLLEGARSAGLEDLALVHATDAGTAGERLAAVVKPGDLVLVKGSRGMHLERVIEVLGDSFAAREA